MKKQRKFEKRKFVRVPLIFSIRHKNDTIEAWQEAFVDDISFEGIKFLSSIDYKVDDLLFIEFEFPKFSGIKQEIKAQVIWREDTKDPKLKCLVGAKFQEVNCEQIEFISKLVSAGINIQKRRREILGIDKLDVMD